MVLGVVLYQCVSHLEELPFDPVELLHNRKKKVPDISLYSKINISSEFAAVVMKSLEKVYTLKKPISTVDIYICSVTWKSI